MKSRERMLNAISCKATDHVPCCFMIFHGLHVMSRNPGDFMKRVMALGLDPMGETTPWSNDAGGDPGALRDIDDPGPRWEFHPDVRVIDWAEETPEGKLVHRRYDTPAGPLTTSVKWTEDWKHGAQVPLFSDFITPRATKFLVETDEDLDRLEYLLQPVDDENRRRFLEEAAPVRAFAAQNDILVHGGQGIGLEAYQWICGIEPTIYACFDRPKWVDRLAEILHTWNMSRMKTVLDLGVDLYTRRGWYEGTDFLTPKHFRRFVLPSLKREAQAAHEGGTRFGYINTSGTMAILDMLIEAEVDVLIGVDPVQGKGTDMAEMRRRTRGRMALWGGVNGFVTVEQGTPHEVRQAVRLAMDTLGGEPGFILSPVDNVANMSDDVWHNVRTLIETWEEAKPRRALGDQ
jgi:hypothetical protein